MANDYSYPAGIWYLDSAFFWNRGGGVTIRKIVYQATTAAHTATFGTYDYADAARATMTSKDCVITGTNNIESTGNFEATEALAGDAIWIKEAGATGLTANMGKFLIKTRTDDNNVILVGDGGSLVPLTNDAAGVYSWVTIAPHIAAKLTVTGTEVCTEELDFGDGLWLPNFSLYQISSGAVWVYLA